MMRVCGWVAVALAAALAATLAWLGVGRAPETTAEARRAMDGWQRRGAWHTWEGVQAHSVFVADSLTGSSSPAEDAAKPVLVLLHGFPTSSFDWLRVWDALAARFRLLAPDFLGFGFSDKPRPHNYSIFEQAYVRSPRLRNPRARPRARRRSADDLADVIPDPVPRRALTRQEMKQNYLSPSFK